MFKLSAAQEGEQSLKDLQEKQELIDEYRALNEARNADIHKKQSTIMCPRGRSKIRNSY